MNNFDVTKTINDFFCFREWSKYKVEPHIFTFPLEPFGVFKIYNNFRELLIDWKEVYLVNRNGKKLDIDEALQDEEYYHQFLNQQFNCSPNNIYRLDYQNINEPFLFGVPNCTGPKTYFELTKELQSEEQLLCFLNIVLSGFGHVTHPHGLKNQYEVIKVGECKC